MSVRTSENDTVPGKTNGDVIGKFFQRPFFLSLTIGIPFCVFKLLFGSTAVRVATPEDLFLIIPGGMVIIWALTDLMMNVGRSVLDLLHRQASFEFCIIAQFGHIFRKPQVFLAIDTLLSFGIICTMLWSGWITKLTLFE